MTPERWVQIEELFHRAAECDPKRRSALLEAACHGDAELQREVESLLANEEMASHELEAAIQSSVGVATFPLAGETVSHYRILNGIGGGGMGLVYAAEDLKLGRRVALKFLPEELITDSKALGRFEREARSASALEHPNICPIYEFGEHEGKPFLVMQLLEGQTLRELISAATPGEPALSVERLVDLAIQIAEGLEAAHKKGIIHRDIKPANIFVTVQGQAKILDFGLAKLASATHSDALEPELRNNIIFPGAGETEAAETPDPYLSRTGVAMGTAGYMSPEQARGEKLDVRTDLFSFGLVLYEMATGQRAFQGDTGPALRDAILKQTPASLSHLNSRYSSTLERIINKALEKDRDSRYASAAAIHGDLLRLKQKVERRSRWREVTAGSVGLLLLIMIASWAYQRRQLPPRSSLGPKLRQLTTNSFENRVMSGAISPDGKYLAYADPQGLRVQIIASGQIKAIPQPEERKGKGTDWEVVNTGWFSDNTRFVVNAHNSGSDGSSPGSSIWIAPIDGRAPTKLRDNAVAYSMSRDSSLISFGTNKGKFGDREIWLMSPAGENPQMLFRVDDNNALIGTHWSPDGQRIIYGRVDSSGATLESRALSGGLPSTIFSSSEMKRHIDSIWLADGRLLYSEREPGRSTSSCNFWTVRINSQTGERVGQSQQVTDWPTACMNTMSVTADGKRLVFLRWEGHLTSYMADLSANGSRILSVRHFPLSENSEGLVDWTPDSKTMLLVSDRLGRFGLYRQLLGADLPEGPLVTPPDGTRCARVTPDGKWVLYFADQKAGDSPGPQPELVVRAPINGGPSQQLFMSAAWSLLTCGSARSAGCAIAEPSADKKQVIFSALDPMIGRGRELARLPADPQDDRWHFDLSADGKQIAYVQTPASPIQIFSLHGSPIQRIRPKGLSDVRAFNWAPDRKGLFVVANSRSSHALYYVDLRGDAHRLWESTGATGETLAKPSPDGRRLAISTWTNPQNMWLMEDF